MSTDPKTTEEQKPSEQHKTSEERSEKEIDPDTEVHKDGSDLIRKESHRISVDDEVKKG